jgi:NAD(P)-dependent dehydrogenase (short-subunit alcohol dehydrogenase family)
MSLDVFQLTGQVALVTGGGTGLGLAIAECFVQAGARVVVVGRRENVLQQACHRLGKAATYQVHDVTQRDTADTLIQRVEQEVGPLSILVNNAGLHLKKLATETTAEEFDSVLQTHVIAAHNLTRAVLPSMIERRDGSILFTASMASLIGMPQVVAYSAAKSAYLGMVRALAVETSEHGVRINAIAPGWIETPMLHKALDSDEDRKNKILGRTPMNRFGQPDDIGWAATYLCSQAAKFVTGVVLPVDGGASIGF